MSERERVIVLGASPKRERYSNQAVRLLVQYGHKVVPVNPARSVIEDLPVAATLGEVEGEVDTVTLYLAPRHSEAIADALLRLKPGRVIFNPGTENPALQKKLAESGIGVVEGCTLVMLKTGQF
ncbi:MAG: CoA-binding protein [Kiritimatiellae bacterium]|nr:CoA-binding protein [Kiritimatiellia bacterium]